MKPSLSSFARSSRPNGFTLMEVIITLVVFVLLAASVFGIITGVFQGASTLQDNQNRRDQIVALNAFLQRKLGGMTAQSEFFSYRRGAGEGLSQNGIIFGQTGMLMAIDAKVQANGYYTLRLASSTSISAQGLPASQLFEQSITSDDPSIAWTPLIHDVRQIDWKFQDFNTTQWVDQWINAPGKPNLVEFSMQQAGDLGPSTMDFWIPRITAPPALVTSP